MVEFWMHLFFPMVVVFFVGLGFILGAIIDGSIDWFNTDC